jgi:hypothetical protein
MPPMTLGMRALLNPHFPNLFNHYVSDEVSEATEKYNCIAWAYGENTRRLWPNLYSYEWPDGITNTETIDSFKELFSSRGYVECNAGDFEEGYLKIAIYANNLGVPKHAARQLPNGHWTSKCGPYIDIEHTIEGMTNGVYGDVVVYMKRPI